MNKLFLAPTTLLDAAPLEFLAVAADAGYDGVGVRLYRSPNLPFHPVVGNAALIRSIGRALADSRLAVLDIFTFYLQPPTDVRDFTPALELGAALGAKYAVVQGDDPDWPRLVRHFAAVCDDAARRGRGVAVEFMPARPRATLDLAPRLRRETARPTAIERGVAGIDAHQIQVRHADQEIRVAVAIDVSGSGHRGAARRADLAGLDAPGRGRPHAQFSLLVGGRIGRRRGPGRDRRLRHR